MQRLELGLRASPGLGLVSEPGRVPSACSLFTLARDQVPSTPLLGAPGARLCPSTGGGLLPRGAGGWAP